MPTSATNARRVQRHVATRLAVTTTLMATVAAACATTPATAPSATPRPATAAPAGTPPAVAEAPSPGSAVSSSPTAMPLAAGPPDARLAGVGGDAVTGTPGSFSWDGFVSDAPWVVGAAVGATAGSSLVVTLEPAARPVRWQARWAPLVDGRPGDARDGGSGTGDPIEVEAPQTPGSWSLLVSAAFGKGRSAAWSWRVDVSP